LKKEQVDEWLENPVTLFLLEEVKKELKLIRETPVSNCLFPGDPNKSQENLVELEARERCWSDWEQFLTGNWDLFMESYEDGYSYGEQL
jgi:hypothetical protein